MVEPGGPQAVSQRAWDAARTKSRFPDAPSARAICDRLGFTWPELLDLAQADDELKDYRLGHRHGEQDQDWLTPEHAIAMLRLVALRLDTQELTRAAYRRERATLLASHRRKWRHGGQLLIPNEDQVVAVCGAWDAALAAAGLEVRGPGGDRARAAPVDLIDARPLLRDPRRRANLQGTRSLRPRSRLPAAAAHAPVGGLRQPLEARADRSWGTRPGGAAAGRSAARLQPAGGGAKPAPGPFVGRPQRLRGRGRRVPPWAWRA